ncbi:DNA-processing protein DprA [Roseovarius sp. LXJ103]|uniref:DNA-processing protein DprA n=1 Tax=Roseovarius carneus TaxID=2853164 RepID=UPI000D61BEF0|nr:DNA-processing protein DprA [Roseovarius carneus]MBZ8117664.1 DNA-processing protein DprA [Roseovarius carneus]PWE36557.1 DNA-protecting protein DprA [Pelagicola sp. LXJ1103]
MSEDTHPSTHPPLPPTTEDDRVSWLRLLRSRRVGVATFYRLLAEHHTAQEALIALPRIARSAGVNGYEIAPERSIRAEMRAADDVGAHMICITDPTYPPLLREIPDPPPILWAIGDLGILSRPMVGMVGARNASSLGTRMARALAADLAKRGYVIASGLARGVDTAAHKAALKGGTVAVMAGGVDVMYPAENTVLAEEIAQTGLRLSEQPVGLIPQARHFPRRNRIISGLASATVIVEAAAKSGSLITARNALEQGRDVLAVPGHPFDARAAGCNQLLRDGARLVRSADDIVEALPELLHPTPQPDLPLQTPQPHADIRPNIRPAANAPTVPAIPAPHAARTRTLRETADLHSEILNRLGPSPLAEDQLIRDLKTPAQKVAPVLLDLELDGRIRRQPGGLLSLT